MSAFYIYISESHTHIHPQNFFVGSSLYISSERKPKWLSVSFSHLTGHELCEIKPTVELRTKISVFLFSDRFSVFLVQLRRCAVIVTANSTSKRKRNNRKIPMPLCQKFENELFVTDFEIIDRSKTSNQIKKKKILNRGDDFSLKS